MYLITILAAAVLANHNTKTYTNKSYHKTILAELNGNTAKTFCLLIILMDDAIMYMCIWPFV